MVAHMETPQQLFNMMHYVIFINMIGRTFHSHRSLHPQLKIFVYISGLLPTACALVQIAFSIPHTVTST